MSWEEAKPSWFRVDFAIGTESVWERESCESLVSCLSPISDSRRQSNRRSWCYRSEISSKIAPIERRIGDAAASMSISGRWRWRRKLDDGLVGNDWKSRRHCWVIGAAEGRFFSCYREREMKQKVEFIGPICFIWTWSENKERRMKLNTSEAHINSCMWMTVVSHWCETKQVLWINMYHIDSNVL